MDTTAISGAAGRIGQRARDAELAGIFCRLHNQAAQWPAGKREKNIAIPQRRACGL